MKKIVLYNPKAVFYDMPLALLSIGSCFNPKEFEVCIVDARVEEDAYDLLIAACKDAICLGVTALSGTPLKDALIATRLIKENLPDLPVVWGGWHPSLFPTDLLEQEPAIDITVSGQGEETFQEIVAAIVNGQSFKGIKGTAFRDGEKVIKNPARLLSDMDELPPVNYDLIDVEKYFKAKGRRQFDYISSTGCFFRCSFCADPFVFKRKWTSISPERMGKELAHWHYKFDFDDLNFQDETFFTYQKRSVEIAQTLVDIGARFTWAATMRADQGTRLSESNFELLKKSGFRRALIGVESGSQEMMDWLKKDIKIEQVLECADRCKEYGISAIFPFIIGFPGESNQSVIHSINFVKTLRNKSHLFQTPIFYFKPYPGSEITQQAIKDGYELPNSLEDWSDFDYVDAKGGPWVSNEKYLLIENFKFYSKLAWSKPRWITYPIRKLAQLRCEKNFYRMPVEKFLAGKLTRKVELS